MKIILIAINAKFVHTNLALRNMRGVLTKAGHGCEIIEYAINQPVMNIYLDLAEKKADAFLLSMYIWNGEVALKLIEMLAKTTDTPLILGGPEIGYRDPAFLKSLPVSAIISGYGEGAVLKYLEELEAQRRDGPKIMDGNKERISLSEIPFPYTASELFDLKNRILYYESTRGCPHHCYFCLSGLDKKYEERDLCQVKQHLKMFVEAGVRQVKFIDRTFNANPKRALEIMAFIVSLEPKNTNFHFEMTAERIDEAMLSFLQRVPAGLFQFEIGIQSIHQETLKAVGRNNDFEILDRVLPRIAALEGVHLHLDLIAGLPFETLDMFRASFDKVYGYGAEKLQLGFLKLIYGSQLYEQKNQYGYTYCDFDMYEVLESQWMTPSDFRSLKKIEDMVERFGNEGDFAKTLGQIAPAYDSMYDFFRDLADFWYEKGYHLAEHRRTKLYDVLFAFISKNPKLKEKKVLQECLTYDFFNRQKTFEKPEFLTETAEIKEKRYEILSLDGWKKDHIPELWTVPAKKLAKRFVVWPFEVIHPQTKVLLTEKVYLVFDLKSARQPMTYTEGKADKI